MSVLVKTSQRSAPLPPLNEKAPSGYSPGRGPSPGCYHPGALILGLSSSQNCEKLLFISYPVCNILLQQPDQTETDTFLLCQSQMLMLSQFKIISPCFKITNIILFIGKCSFGLLFLKKFVSERCYFFFKCLVGFTNESVWAQSFCVGRFFIKH